MTERATAAVISIPIDPMIHIGPLSLAWHGVMIAVGILVGGYMAVRFAREARIDPDGVVDLVLVIAIAGMLGTRVFFLIENEPGALLRPEDWLSTNGFAFYGAIVFGVPAAAAYMRWRGFGLGHLDALAAGFPLGMAVGRIGDVINGEHYGPPSDLPWAIQNTHPEADVPSPDVAYHSGGLYEIVLALAMFAIVWPLRHRFRPGVLLCLVVALYSAGRFAMFFVRSDSEDLVAGLSGAQWASLALFVVAVAGMTALRRRRTAAVESRQEA